MSHRFSKFAVAALLAALLPAATAVADDWGTLTGKFVITGDAPKPKEIDAAKTNADCKDHKVFEESVVVNDKGELANVFVYLRTAKPKVAPSYDADAKAEIVLDNKQCRFEPHCLVYRAGQTLKVTNSDPFGHNSNIAPFKNKQVNPIIPAGKAVDVEFDTAETLPTKVGCNIHSWMGAWVLIRTDPYAAVSGEDGTFTIKDLPVGTELEFQLWHEAAGNLKNLAFKGGKADSKGRFKFKVKKGDNDLGEIKVPVASLKK